MVADDLTIWNGNGMLERLLNEGRWSLMDTPEAVQAKAAAAKIRSDLRLTPKQCAFVIV